LLVLDEPTSALDGDSERIVLATLARTRSSRTTLVIAHRLSTVVDADCIVVMEAGRIVDQGTHGELFARCALYRRLWQPPESVN
jgi:ABC-type multidrug transport system fused ATPase/permease subunit